MTEATFQPPESQFLTNNPINLINRHRIFSFEGRIGRVRFSSYLFSILVCFLSCHLITEVLGQGVGAVALDLIINLVFLLPVFIVLTRRINDLGRSGYWALLVLVPIVNLLLLSALYLLPGNHRANQYGNPVQRNNLSLFLSGIVLPGSCLFAAFYIVSVAPEYWQVVTELVHFLVQP